MKIKYIATLSDFFEVIGKSNPHSPNLFRGVTKKAYKLIPSIARGVHFPSDESAKFFLQQREKKTVEMLKGIAEPYIDQQPQSYMEWVVLAQHFGAKTRLLDWSKNCLVALFFATEKHFESDGAVYIFRTPGNVEFEHSPLFGVNNIIRPKNISSRISAQGSVFTFTEDAHKPFDDDKIEVVLVPSQAKWDFQLELARMGISHGSLFPGLEGICCDINRMWEKDQRTSSREISDKIEADMLGEV
jgi:type I restriction enzyme M protein